MKKSTIIIHLLFIFALALGFLGGYLLTKGSSLGILSITFGFIVIYLKWKYQDKLETQELPSNGDPESKPKT